MDIYIYIKSCLKIPVCIKEVLNVWDRANIGSITQKSKPLIAMKSFVFSPSLDNTSTLEMKMWYY